MVATSGTRDRRGWDLAKSLGALVDECDARAPDRSTASDGSISSAAHQQQNPNSDHDPDASGDVLAVDITDDKAGGCDADALAHHLVANRDPRVAYVIWNQTIVKSYDSSRGPAWQPQPYTGGSNPHITHTHISIKDTAAAKNDLSPWWPTATTPPSEEDDMPANLIIKGDNSREWWVTDGLTKKYLTTPADASHLVHLGLARWDPNTKGPVVVDQGFVDRLPKI